MKQEIPAPDFEKIRMESEMIALLERLNSLHDEDDIAYIKNLKIQIRNLGRKLWPQDDYGINTDTEFENIKHKAQELKDNVLRRAHERIDS